MSIFGDVLFGNDYARIGRFLHNWTFAVWKKDPTYRAFAEDDNPATLELAIYAGYVVRDKKGLRFTGPSKEPRWLLDKSKKWKTYVIEAVDQGLIKIGKSTDVDRRFEELQVASPHELRVLVVWNGDRESRLHKQFNAHRVGGEWFRYTDEVRDAIAATEGR
jgi:hypothetical protein